MKTTAHDHLSEGNSSDLANGVKVVHGSLSLVESNAFYDHPDVIEPGEVGRALRDKSTVYLVPKSQENRFSRPRDNSLRGRIWRFREGRYCDTSIMQSAMFTLMGVPLSFSPVQYLGIAMFTVGSTTTGALVLSSILLFQKEHKAREGIKVYPSVKMRDGVTMVKVPRLGFEWSSTLVNLEGTSTVVLRLKKLLKTGASATEIKHELDMLSVSKPNGDYHE